MLAQSREVWEERSTDLQSLDIAQASCARIYERLLMLGRLLSVERLVIVDEVFLRICRDELWDFEELRDGDAEGDES